MKILKNSIYGILAAGLLFIANSGVAQIVGSGGYLLGDYVQVGVNANGYEGAPNIAGSHARSDTWTSSAIWFGFVANPAMDGWGNYDGDFFTPGSPENGFGVRVAGIDYSNNSTGWPAPQIIGSVTGYATDGDCMMVDWEGSVAGLTVHLQYKLIKTELYYTTKVTLTNTTGSDMTDVYYYRNFDPDNNEPIGWGFMTQNTIHAQPNPSCEIALVSAEQLTSAGHPWNSYVGLGAIGSNFRVTYGGFSNRNAYNIWNGVSPFVLTTSATTYCDCAISLAYKVPLLAAGTSEEFQFTVVLSGSDVDAAIASLYYFDYEGGGGTIDECSPVVDTIQICAGDPTEISVAGPSSSDYTWDWTPTTDITPTTGETVTVSPTTTTTYTVTGTPTVSCLSTTISKDIVVQVVPSPIIDVTDPGPQCGDFDLSTLVFTDLSGTPGVFSEFYSVPPDSADQVAGIWPSGTLMSEGDDVWLLMGEPVNMCFDSLKLDIDFGGAAKAGPDSSAAFCNSTGTSITISDYLSLLADAGGTWSETTAVPSGAFDPLTTVLTADGLAGGDYTFEYVAYGTGICANDTAVFTITISEEVNAGADNNDARCNSAGESIDLNTLLSSDADAGGVWAETTSPASGSFNPATGIFTTTGLTGGDYTFTYTVPTTAPCTDDVADFTITVNEIPDVVANPADPGGDIQVCEGTSVVLTGGGAGAGGIYVWDGGVTNGISFIQAPGTTVYTVTGTDANGCANTDDISVTVFPTPVIALIADTLVGCTPFQVTFTGSSVPASASCTWSFGDGNSSTACGVVSNTYVNEGTFDVSLNVIDINGCVNSLTYADYITTAATPVATFSYSPGQVFADNPELSFTNSSLNSTEYLWDFGDGSALSSEVNPTHLYPFEGDKDYTVTLTASNYLGCFDVTEQIIHVDEWIIFYIPNIFTPDGDEYNQTFKPVFYSGVDPYDYHMTIFNRYGEIIWESYNFNAGWDGSYGSQGLVQDGTYVWQIEFKEKSSDKRYKHHGHVTILK